MHFRLKTLSRKMRSTVPMLVNGDCLTQPEFHRRYEACPEDVKFELVGGIVYLTPPNTYSHGSYQEELCFALGVYRRATSGVHLLPNVTIILGDQSEPQPDLTLLIDPDFGGQSHETEDEYVGGPPELIAEIAYSTRSIDMHQKKSDYRLAGVREYVVVCIEQRELHWFRFPRGSITADTQGTYKSRMFPGLWIDGQALLDLNSDRVLEVLQQGLASREHAAFVKRLQAAYRKRT
jgi:Uma2 family endonuclease